MATTETVNILIRAKNEATAALKGVESQLGGITKSVIGMAAAYMTLDAGIGIIKNLVRAGVEEERQWLRVGAAVKAAQFDYARALPAIQKITDALEMKYLLDDQIISQAWNRLLPVIKNINEGYRILETAANLAAWAQVDLNTATVALIAAHEGQFMNLQRLTKIGFTDAEKAAGSFELALARVNSQVAGQAAANMTDYEQRVGQLGKTWEHLTETIGKGLVYTLTGLMDVVLPGGIKLFPDRTVEDVSQIGTDIKKLTDNAIELSNVISVTGSKKSLGLVDSNDAAVFRENAIAVSTLNRELDSLSDLPPISMEDIYGVGSDEDIDNSRFYFNQMVDGFHDTRRAAEEAARAQQRSFDRVASTARDVLDPLHDWILAGQSIQSTFAAMGARIKQIIAEQIVNALAQAIAQALLFKAVTSSIFGGFGGGGFEIGQQAISILPFDNRQNDSMLQREVMWVGQLITRGLTAGMQREIPMGQPAMATSGAAPNITLNFHGPVTSEKFVNDTIIPALEKAAKLNKTSVKLNNTHLTGKRDGFGY